MDGNVIGFIGWTIVGISIVVIGIIVLFSKKPAGFWANVSK